MPPAPTVSPPFAVSGFGVRRVPTLPMLRHCGEGHREPKRPLPLRRDGLPVHYRVCPHARLRKGKDTLEASFHQS